MDMVPVNTFGLKEVLSPVAVIFHGVDRTFSFYCWRYHWIEILVSL